jgi:quinol monooxygenase YgiN
MIVITGTVRFPLDRLAEARPHMQSVVAASRQEDGCINYAFAEDVLDPGLILIAEAWRDQAALSAHAQSAHFLAWRAAGAELGAHERNLTVYEAISSRPL